MRSLLKRAATTAVCALGITVGLSGTAQADHITVLPGCWGALGVVYCDLGVDVDATVDVPVYTYEWDAEVCTGTCSYYRLPFAWYDLNRVPDVDNVCVTAEDRWGWEYDIICAV